MTTAGFGGLAGIHGDGGANSLRLVCAQILVYDEFEMTIRITVNPQIHFGKPCVAGTRIPVQDVLELVQDGLSFADITRDYHPDLTADDIRACIQYAREVIAAEDIHVTVS